MQLPHLARSFGTDMVRSQVVARRLLLTVLAVPAFRCRKSDQCAGEEIKQMVVKGALTSLSHALHLPTLPSGGLTAVHRAEFYDVLVQKLASSPQYATHTSKRLVSYSSPTPDGPITLDFADGTTSEADVVIGSDGLRSATRATMYEALAAETGNPVLRQHIRAKFSGLISYRTVIPREKLAALNPNHRALCGPVQVCRSLFRFHGVRSMYADNTRRCSI